ncbi:MAG: hypothetical protein PHY45_05955 [Rhodocyclaceae bacterium]|nr:hypothetical protein [Rhodocyclaceae bacterium]
MAAITSPPAHDCLCRPEPDLPMCYLWRWQLRAAQRCCPGSFSSAKPARLAIFLCEGNILAALQVDQPTCAKCAHYFITHDPRFPYGCRAMGFKSRRLPQEEISQATGARCLAYQRRTTARDGCK